MDLEIAAIRPCAVTILMADDAAIANQVLSLGLKNEQLTMVTSLGSLSSRENRIRTHEMPWFFRVAR